MYLHLGQDTVVRLSGVIGIFDIENCTISRHTKRYLSKAQEEGRVINVSPELPKSFVVCMENGTARVYISQISASTLHKRSGFTAQLGMME